MVDAESACMHRDHAIHMSKLRRNVMLVEWNGGIPPGSATAVLYDASQLLCLDALVQPAPSLSSVS